MPTWLGIWILVIVLSAQGDINNLALVKEKASDPKKFYIPVQKDEKQQVPVKKAPAKSVAPKKLAAPEKKQRSPATSASSARSKQWMISTDE